MPCFCLFNTNLYTLAESFVCFSLQQYYSSGRMLVKLAEAIGRLVLAGREMTRLAGFTARVTELMAVLKDINLGNYQRTMVDDNINGSNAVGKKLLSTNSSLYDSYTPHLPPAFITIDHRLPLPTPPPPSPWPHLKHCSEKVLLVVLKG